LNSQRRMEYHSTTFFLASSCYYDTIVSCEMGFFLCAFS
jgi:hypothetical protein